MGNLRSVLSVDMFCFIWNILRFNILSSYVFKITLTGETLQRSSQRNQKRKCVRAGLLLTAKLQHNHSVPCTGGPEQTPSAEYTVRPLTPQRSHEAQEPHEPAFIRTAGFHYTWRLNSKKRNFQQLRDPKAGIIYHNPVILFYIYRYLYT